PTARPTLPVLAEELIIAGEPVEVVHGEFLGVGTEHLARGGPGDALGERFGRLPTGACRRLLPRLLPGPVGTHMLDAQHPAAHLCVVAQVILVHDTGAD